LNIDLTTPALLFPAISLLLLAFTNRFLAIASLIRQLHVRYEEHPDPKRIKGQIENLRARLFLIRNMQAFGVLSFFTCVLTMIFVYAEVNQWANITFGFSLFLLLVSLALSVIEIQKSTSALEIELSDMELKKKRI
jgi:hypothetical protein